MFYMFTMMTIHFVLFVFGFCVLIAIAHANRYTQNIDGKTKIMHEWVTLEYDFPSPMKRSLIDRKLLIPENLVLYNMDGIRGRIFTTIGRTSKPGIPATLNTVVKRNGKSFLKPFPFLKLNRAGDCNSIQSAQSVKIDPNTNYIWVLDEGKVNNIRFCRRKLVGYCIRTRKEVFRHIFPDSVLSESSMLFGLTLDRDQGITRYVYVVDSFANKLIVVDVVKNASWLFSHPSMVNEANAGNITVNGETIFSRGGINGISTTSDFKFVYYFCVASFKTWQIPTSILRNPSADSNEFDENVRMIGIRQHHAVSLTSGTRSFFFPALEINDMIKWDRKQDILIDGSEEVVNLRSLQRLSQTTALNFADGIHVDNGYLYFVTNKLHKVRLGNLDFTGDDGPNFTIGKIFVGEESYLLGTHPKSYKNKVT
ncbi:major royal jelly protein 1-like [Mytilus trossulus]|uniref:major royal jelly protein 1-like n=1 Tax=Mytilus trossulus TaxID=6551 RepID=UPI0030076253